MSSNMDMEHLHKPMMIFGQDVLEVKVESLNSTATAQLEVTVHPLPSRENISWTRVGSGSMQVGQNQYA